MNKIKKIFQYNSVYVPLIAVLLGLFLGAIVMIIGGYNPVLAYSSLTSKIFGNAYDSGETIRTIIPLIMSGLAVTVANKAGIFNIGVDGQIVMGGLGALIIGTKLSLPPIIHGIVAILFGAILGGLWGALIGVLKAKKGINEVISSIMLNYIALYISHMAIKAYMPQQGTQRSQLIKESASIGIGWLSGLFGGARIHFGIFIAIAVVIIYSIYIKRTKWGYEIETVGLNQNAAKYSGMDVSKIVIRSMFLSGLIGGLIGTFDVLGVYNYMAISPSTSGIGFDGVAISLLGNNSPIGAVLAGSLVGALNYGSQGMAFGAGVPSEIINMVIASIIFFVAAPGVVKQFFGKKIKKEA